MLELGKHAFDISNGALNRLMLIPNARSLKVLSLAAINGFPGVQKPEDHMARQITSQMQDSPAFRKRIIAYIASSMQTV